MKIIFVICIILMSLAIIACSESENLPLLPTDNPAGTTHTTSQKSNLEAKSPTVSSQSTVTIETSSNEMFSELSAVCQLVSDEHKISCQPQRTSEDSSLNWSENNWGTSSTSNDFEFLLNDPIAVNTLVTLEECVNSICTKIITSVNTSSLASISSATGSSSSETRDQQKVETEKVTRDEIRTMQSEYSRGRCDPDGVKYLDSPPMNTDEIILIQPMGVIHGDHITPIDHLYIHYELGSSHDVLAMADGYIVHIGHSIGVQHRIIIEYSCQLYSIYIHVDELPEAIETQLEWTGGEDTSKGRAYTRIPVKSGAVVGRESVGQSIDLSVVDTKVTLPGFVNLESYRGEFWKSHCVDPYDYWNGDFAQKLLDKTIIINEESPGGKIDYDVAGKLIGNWFEKNTGGYSGERFEGDFHGVKGHLAFVYSILVRDTLAVSFGSWENSGARRFFVRDNAPDPATIGLESGLVRYELTGAYQGKDRNGNCCDSGFEVASTGERWYGDTYPEEGELVATLRENPTGVVLVEMLDEQTIKVETFGMYDGARRRSLEETSKFTDNFKIYTR